MQQNGLIHIYTGNGKGKTTAAIGLAVRATGAKKKVLFAQFMKGSDTAELIPMQKLGITTLRNGSSVKFVFQMDEEEKQLYRAQQTGNFEAAIGACNHFDMLVLDEISSAIAMGMVPLDSVTTFLSSKPPALEVVLTGRDFPEELLAGAHYISNIQAVRHPYEQGIQARKGIEF